VAIFPKQIATTSVRTGLAMTVELSVKYQIRYNPHRCAEPRRNGHARSLQGARGSCTYYGQNLPDRPEPPPPLRALESSSSVSIFVLVTVVRINWS